MAVSGVAAAQPGEPISYYGEATADGDPIAEGTTLVLAVDGEQVDSIAVGEDGVYATDDIESDKLRTDTNAGDEVTFHIGNADGPQAAETDTIGDSGVYEQDLTFSADEVPEDITLDLNGETGSLTLGEGDTADATVTATFADGSDEDVTGDLDDFSSSDETTVSVDGTTITAEDTGSATVTAEYIGLSDSVDVTVEAEDDDDDDTGNGAQPGAPGGTGDGGISVDTPDIDDDLGDDAEITNEDERIIDVDPDTGTSSVTMSQESNVVSIVFSDLNVEGTVNVRNIEGTPAATGSPPGDTATTSFITVPEQVRDSPATVTKRISADRLDELDASADQLVVQRYSNGEWSNLDTEVASESDSEVTVEAETPGFSYFAVSAVDEEPDDDEPVEAPDEDGIGMTALIGLVVVIALIAVAAVAYRQLNDDGGDSNF